MKKNYSNITMGIMIIGILTIITLASYLQPYKIGAEYRGLKDYSEVDGSATIPITINDFTFTVDTHMPDAMYDTGWLTTEADTAITVGNFSACRVWINDIEVTSGETIYLRLTQLNVDTNICIKIVDDRSDWARQIYVRTLPVDFPQMDILKSDLPRDGTLCYVMGNFLVKMDMAGNILYYRVSSLPKDFQSVKLDNRVRYTFMEQTGISSVSGLAEYKAVIMNEAYQVIDILEYAKKDGQTQEKYALCQYGFKFLEDGHYLVAANQPIEVDASFGEKMGVPLGGHLLSTIVQEIKDGAVIWQWNTLEHSALFVRSLAVEQDLLKQYVDFAHLTDMDIDTKSGSIYLSFENIDGLIEYAPGSGEVQLHMTDGLMQDFHRIRCISLLPNRTILLYGENEAGKGVLLNQDLQSNSSEILDFGQTQATESGSAEISDDGRYLLISWGNAEGSNILATEFDLLEKKISFEIQMLGGDKDVYIDRIYSN